MPLGIYFMTLMYTPIPLLSTLTDLWVINLNATLERSLSGSEGGFVQVPVLILPSPDI